MSVVPIVIEKDGGSERAFDIYSRLLKDRIIMLGTGIDDSVANVVVAQLLFLEASNPDEDIKLYIQSPGGYITAGFAIYDTMRYIKPDVQTICIGQAASMGAFLLSAGAKGKRFALPNAEIMIHQPSGGYTGQATDVEIHAKHMLRLKDRLNRLFAEHTGQKPSKIKRDKERDFFMSADEAVKYGIVDEVVASRTELAEAAGD